MQTIIYIYIYIFIAGLLFKSFDLQNEYFFREDEGDIKPESNEGSSKTSCDKNSVWNRTKIELYSRKFNLDLSPKVFDA